MTFVRKTMLLMLLGSLLPAVGHAAQPSAVTSLNCSFTDGETLSLPVYAYTVDTAPGPDRFVAVYTDASQFNRLAYLEYFFNNFSYCSLADNATSIYLTSTIEDVTLTHGGQGVAVEPKDSAIYGAPHAYAGVIFSYETLEIGASSSPAAVAKPTPEEKRAALRAFKAGLVAPGK